MNGLREFEYIFGGPYRKRDTAEQSLEESFADGEIDHTQSPRVATLRNHRGKITGFALVLTDVNLARCAATE